MIIQQEKVTCSLSRRENTILRTHYTQTLPNCAQLRDRGASERRQYRPLKIFENCNHSLKIGLRTAIALFKSD